jgi:hypothetical protein
MNIHSQSHAATLKLGACTRFPQSGSIYTGHKAKRARSELTDKSKVLFSNCQRAKGPDEPEYFFGILIFSLLSGAEKI